MKKLLFLIPRDLKNKKTRLEIAVNCKFIYVINHNTLSYSIQQFTVRPTRAICELITTFILLLYYSVEFV